MKNQSVYIIACLLCLCTTSLTGAQQPSTDTTIKTLKQTNLSPTSTYRQEAFTLSGRVLDAETGESSPYVSIRIDKLGLMTVSNEEGYWSFKLPATAANETLTFKYMGYTTQSIPVSQMPDKVDVYLQPQSIELNQVVVSPDKKFEILRNAWSAIPKNYPTQPTLTQGFFRETQQVNDSLFLYFNEAVLNVYKNTYRNNQNFGQIEVEKSRKNVFPGIDSINNVRFYGGPHFPNELDIVFSRCDFIKPSEFKNWTYDLEGGYTDNGHFLYTIYFKHKYKPLSNMQGRMIIDGDTYAFVGFELKQFGLASFNAAEDLPDDIGYAYGTTTINIGYVEHGNTYFLSHINYKTNGINMDSKVRVYKNIEYVTTKIQTDSVSPIPYDRQFDYTDILSIKADDYGQSYWKDYTILQESQLQTKQTNLLVGQQAAIDQLKKVYNTALSNQDKTFLFLKRFTFEGGISYHPLRFSGGKYAVGYGALPAIDPTVLKNLPSRTFGFSTTDGLRFQLSKKWSLVGSISTALYGMDQFQTGMGINFRTPLFPSGRWVFFDVGVGPNWSTSLQELGTMTTTGGSLSIGNKTLSSSVLDVKAVQTTLDAQFIVGLSVRMGKRYEVFAEGHYQLPVYKQQAVQLKETEGFFLSRSAVKVKWDDPNLFVMSDETDPNAFNRVTTSSFTVEPWYIRVGIRSGF